MPRRLETSETREDRGGRAHLLEFVRRESPDGWPWILRMAAVAGIANGVLVGVINSGAAVAASRSVSAHLLILFGLTTALYVVAKRAALERSTALVESMVRSARSRVSDKIRRSELSTAETLGRAEFYPRLTEDTNSVSESASVLIESAQQAITLLVCVLYVAWLSLTALLITLVAVSVAIYVYRSHREEVRALYRELARVESNLFASLAHLLDGFKELKLHRKRSEAFFKAFEEIVQETERLKTKAGLQFVSDSMFSTSLFWILVGSIVFLIPRLDTTYPAVVTKVTMATLFILATTLGVMSAVPVLARANAALGNLYALEGKLDLALARATFDEPSTSFDTLPPFTTIGLRGVTHSYPDQAGGSPAFTVGPVDLLVTRGETVFLVGSNGTGKTTLLKLMTGLYAPDSGEIVVDGAGITRENVAEYRELFSAVFSEFHLFDRLYGMEDVDETRVAELLKATELDDKTAFLGGRFTHLDLSSGQRRRLALVVTLLEDRPVYVFDEWAGDQDPRFRRYFYEVLLRELKERGKTIVVVSHDDRYWAIADRIVEMEGGRIMDAGVSGRSEEPSADRRKSGQ